MEINRQKIDNHVNLPVMKLVGEVADKAFRSLRRVVVLPEVIDNTVETGLLEPDVHPCAGIQRTQTDQSVLKSIFHREPAGPSVQRVILRNDHTGGRVQFRNNNHVAMIVKHLTDGVPMDAVGGIGDVIVQVNMWDC